MPEKQKINILWYTRDLRVRDQESLYRIMQEELPFLAVYIFDPDTYAEGPYGFRKTGKFRAKFTLESVHELETNLKSKGIPFVIRMGTTESVFRELSDIYDIQQVFCQSEWTQEETERQDAVKRLLTGTSWTTSYSQLLTDPDAVVTKMQKIPVQFTAFREKLEKDGLPVRQEFGSDVPTYRCALPENKMRSDEVSLEKLGFADFEQPESAAFPFSGGEHQALDRLHDYFQVTKNLSRYKETRNGLVGADYSSKFSAWLADGSLSAVTVYHEIKRYEAEHGNNESTYWLVFELLWREFFRYVSLQHGNMIFQRNGILNKEYVFTDDQEAIEQWTSGTTESDFVNANMKELIHTGYMSNRGRQNAASYFCKTLGQDWRIGAAFFEEMLVDYDVHSNYGNWMYLAGVGNDPRNRTFNTEQQAAFYDQDKQYRNLWLSTNPQ
ncbi:DASH family cryptochrome [uncultured Chryseobacterium sp.]|uniref:DASH family cryptochrome n=1 Tax=uncultured Chryseobacterium sp. TaxID=259322 RepID=UPI0025E77E71|nr:DASH family cryptochrome [uncultured Chryseobacterium sp.]